MTPQGRTVTEATMMRIERLRPVNMLISLVDAKMQIGALRPAARGTA
jgi:hypothetical protein